MPYDYEKILDSIDQQRNGLPPAPLPPASAPANPEVDTLGLSIQRAAGANPVDEAKRRKLSGQLGIPAAILPPTAQAEEQAFLKNAKAQEIMAKYPALAKWAQNPDNAAVAGKDMLSLGDIENTARTLPSITDSVLGVGKNLAGSAAAAFPTANAAIWSFVQAAGSILSANATKPLADTLGSPDVGEMLRSTAADFRQRQLGMARDLAPNMSDMGTIERGVYSGVQSAATTLMMLPLSVATGSPTPVLAGLSGVTAGTALGTATDAGLPLNQALVHATKQGLIEYGTELFPMGNLLKNLTGKTGLMQTAKEFLVREGIGEQVATVLQDLDEWATLHPEKPFSEYLAERPEAALETLVATAVGGSIQVGGAKVVAKGIESLQRKSVLELQRAQQAEEHHLAIQQLGAMAATHPLKERDPQAFHNFIETMAEDGNLSDVYVNGNVLGEVLNQSGVMVDEIARKMPEVAQQLGEAAKTNGEVRISLADYATYIVGTDVEKGLLDHLRASPEGMTYTEAQQFYQSQKDDLSKQAASIMADAATTEEYQADVQKVHDNILDQMNKAGRFTPEVNAAYAVPFREFYAVNAARMGLTPSQLYEQMPLNFAPMNAGNILNQEEPVVRTIYRGTTGSEERIRGGIAEGLLFAAADEKTAKLYGENIEQIGVKQGAKVLVEGTAEFKKLTKRRGGKLLNSMRPGENLKTASDDAVAKAKEAGYDAVEFTSFKDLGIAIINEKAFVRNYSEQLAQSPMIPQTETPEFKAWFGDSKVVDADGKPLRLFHGTNQDIPSFDTERRGASTSAVSAKNGFWFTDSPVVASEYADLAASKVISDAKNHERKTAKLMRDMAAAERRGNWDKVDELTAELEEHELGAMREGAVGGNVMPVYLDLKNPLVVEINGQMSTGTGSDYIEQAKRGGHDGMILKSIEDSPATMARSDHYVAFNPEQIKSATGNSGAFNPNDPNILNQSVFHGTPHVWAPEPGFPHGRPRLDKMGTGEGAQAFGWGWYSAENQGIAKGYADTLSNRGVKPSDLVSADGVPLAEMLKNVSHALVRAKVTRHITDAQGDMVKAAESLDAFVEEQMNRAEPPNLAGQRILEEAQAEMARLAKAKITFKPKPEGTLYSLDIPDAVLPRLLDWDKPLSEQTPEVREAIEKAGIKLPDPKRMDGKEIYGFVRMLEAQKDSPERLSFAPSEIKGYDKTAAEYLASIGIVGNRYLDGGSRKDGKGTYNYVIWDQPTLDKIALLERNGEKLDAIREADILNQSGINPTEQAVQRWKDSVSKVSAGRLDYVPVMSTPAVLREMGVKVNSLELPTRVLMQIHNKHPDIPMSVFGNLPALLADPTFVFPHREGGLTVVVNALTDKGAQIAVGVRDGKVRTITPVEDMGEASAAQRLSTWLESAVARHGIKVYARNKEALAAARASGTSGAPSALIALRRGPRGLMAPAGQHTTQRSSTIAASIVTREGLVKKYGESFYQENRAGYNPETFTISLLKGADLSSTLHEGAHFYLEALAELASRPEAPQQIKDDFRKTLEWFGITGNEVTEPGTRGGDLGQKPIFEEGELIHGTSIDLSGKILDEGLIPQQGAFIQEMYGDEGVAGPAGVFFVSPTGDMSGAVTAMKAAVGRALGKDKNKVTLDDVRTHGAVVVTTPDPDTTYQLEEDGSSISLSGYVTYDDPPAGTEPGDYYSLDEQAAERLITGDDLVTLVENVQRRGRNLFQGGEPGTRGGDLGQAAKPYVLDEKGEPLVLHHGTSDGSFTEFKPKFGGIYFSPDREFSEAVFQSQNEYEGRTLDVHLKMERPFDARWKSMSEEDKAELRGIVDSIFDEEDTDTFREQTENPDWDPFESFTDGELWIDAGRNWQDKVVEAIRREGYDGVIFNDAPSPGTTLVSYVVFDPSQIDPVGTILNQGGEPGTPGDLPPGRTPEEVWDSMSLDQKRPYHEQWAQSFERYMLEGKAPTTELQPVFARFRAWMLNVYRSLEAFLKQNPLAGKLNDEVRGIFDRLLAAEDSIHAAESAREYAPIFETAEEAGVAPKQYQDYLDLGKEATEQAIDDLSSRSLRDMKWLTNAKERIIKDLQKEAKAKRKVVEEEVRREVMAEPIEQARTFLKTGEMTDPETGDLIKAEAGFKLDSEAVAALFPAGGTVTLNKDRMRGMTATDGLSPDLAAQMFGFPSGEALILELSEGETAKEKIEAITDQRMLERHGELSSEEDMQRAAEAAIHNDARARFMATGLKILSKSPLPANQLSKAAKAAAENTIASRKVRDLRPGQYQRAEAAANKEALKLAGKDPQGAVQAQRAALLNNRLAKAAADATKEVEKILRYVVKFDNKGTRDGLDPEYLEQIDDLLRPFDFRKGVSLKQIDKRQSLADWVSEQEALGFEPAIDPAKLDEAKLKSYKNMTMEELRGFVDSIKQVEHLGRLKKKLLTAKDQREFDAIVLEGLQSIEDNANRTVEEKATPTDAVGVMGKWWRQMTADHRKFSSIMREMDGGKNNGFMFNYFLKPMNEAGDNETQMKAEATEALAKLFSQIKKDPVPGNIYAKKRMVPGTNLSMTHEQRIMFAMNWGNEGNRQRLLDGGISGNRALSPAQAQKVLDTLTKEEWDFVQGVWDYIAGYKDQVAALEKRLTGVEPEWIEPAPIQTKYGTYKGGYFPVKYDVELSSRSESFEAATDLRMGMKGAFNASATRNGFTKARAEAVINRPILLSYNAVAQHVSEVTHRLAWQEWLVDANRLLKALDNPIREHYGAELLRTLRDTVVDIAAGDAPAKNGTETAINRLRVGSTIVGMGWRFTTALLQPSGLAQSWVRVGGKYVARGVRQFMKSPITSGEFVNSKSKLMTDRGRTMQREINEVLNTIRAGDKVSTFKASYFTMIGKMQRMVDIPTWLGAYERATDELKLQDATSADERARIEEQAAALADQAVLDSQSGGQLKDLAKVQRGSPLQKIFTNFYSYFSATYNLNVEAVRRTNFKSPSQVAMLATDMLLLNSVPVLFSVALKELLKGGCGDDLECLGEKLASEQLNFLFGQMVLLREAGVAIDVAAGGQGFGYQGPAGLRFFADLYKLGQQANQGEADMAFFKAANQVGGAILHYPAGQINATVEGIMAIEEGKVEGAAILPALLAGPPKK